MSEPEDILWCDECGCGHPWKASKRKPTLRRRLVAPIDRVLCAVKRPLSVLSQALYDWADKPHREAYKKIREAQYKRDMERLEREKRAKWAS